MVEIHDLHVRFHGASREAVAGIDLTIRDGEVVGLVGESGSGKTVTAMTLSGLIERKKVTLSGEVRFDGRDILRLPRAELRAIQGRELGVDFQAWKNNEGTDFFSVGGRFRDNWAATYGGTMARPQGSERTSFYNFNPKWNTRYLDFLTSKGKAKIAYSGEVTVRQNTTSTLSRTTQIFYTDTTVPPDDTQETIDNWFTRPLDNALQALGKESPGNGIRIGKDNQQNVTRAPQSFGFTMTVKAGEKVVVGKFTGTDVTIDKEDYKFVKQDDILAVVTD